MGFVMFNSREEVMRCFGELSLPKIFRDIWNGTTPRSWLVLYPAPYRYFMVGQTWIPAHDLDPLIPLLEENLEYLYGYDRKAGEYVRYDYRTGERKVIGVHYQQFIGWLFTELCFAGLLDIAEEYTDAFNFRYIDELRKWASEDDDQNSFDAQRAFVDQLRD